MNARISVHRRPAAVRSMLRRPVTVAAGLLAILLAMNFAVRPTFLDPPYFAPTLAIFAVLALAAFASTPSILSGGIDVSIGPLLGLVNVLIVVVLMPNHVDVPWLALPMLLLLGLVVGTVNGFLVAVVRLPAVVATLGTYLVLNGLSVQLLPTPLGPAPGWVEQLGNTIGPVPGAVILIGAAGAIWFLICRTPYHKALLSVGGDEAVAYSTGINTVLVKIVAYALGGLLASLAGVALTAVIGSADATVGSGYTVRAIAAVALGGTSLSGGRGGMTASLLGAGVIFLIQNLLTLLGASVSWLQLAYGAILVVSLIGGSQLVSARGKLEGMQ